MSMYCYNEACTKDFLDLEKDVTLAKHAGFDLIELRFDCINKYLENHSISDLKSLLDDTKIKPSALNALYIYPEFLSQKDIKEKRDTNIKILKLEVNEKNLIAINLYKSFGFKQTGIREKYYNNHDSAILMDLEIFKH